MGEGEIPAEAAGDGWGTRRGYGRSRGASPLSVSDGRPAELEDRVFYLLLIAVSAAFVLIVEPLFGAVLWGVIIAIVFAPLYRWMARATRQRRTLAAILTEAIIIVMVLLPLSLLVAVLIQEAIQLYQRIQSGEIDFGRYFQQIYSALPPAITGILERLELTSQQDIQARITSGLTSSFELLAGKALNIGQNALSFLLSTAIMLYLLFFLLRDGEALALRIKDGIPLHPDQRRELIERFAVVIRATIKGSLIVGLVQGFLGGLILWILGIQPAIFWGALMAVLSLLPAVGTGLVWGPVAIYFFATGAIGKGIILSLFGVLVIGMVDNVLRPMLVGKDTSMPDYIILITTLGGIALFGFNGVVIGPVIAALFMAVWGILTQMRARAAIERARVAEEQASS